MAFLEHASQVPDFDIETDLCRGQKSMVQQELKRFQRRPFAEHKRGSCMYSYLHCGQFRAYEY